MGPELKTAHGHILSDWSITNLSRMFENRLTP